MASQSHDVGLCEYSRWQGDRMAPAERLEDNHNLTWGAMGYKHLDAAEKQGRQALDATLADLCRRIGSAAAPGGPMAVTVFNPHAWPRTDVAATGRVFPLPPGTKDLFVKDRSGSVVPSQVVRSSRDPQGNLTVAEVAFQARQVPAAGYDTYYLELRDARGAGGLRQSAHRRSGARRGERVRSSPCGPEHGRHRELGVQSDRSRDARRRPGRFSAPHRPSEPQLIAQAQPSRLLRHRQIEGRDRLAGQGTRAPRAARSTPCRI